MIILRKIWLKAWGLRSWQLRRSGRAIIGTVERPLPGQPSVHGFEVKGWVVAPPGQTVAVVVTANGQRVWEGVAETARPDVTPKDDRQPRGFSGFAKLTTLPPSRIIWVQVHAGERGQPVESYALLHSFPIRRTQTSRQPPRWAYGAVWNNSSRTLRNARISVAGYADQAEWDRSGLSTAQHIAKVTRMTPNDAVLEIGCGAGRVGDKMAPMCREWTGADVSQNMLGFAKEALTKHPNVRFVHLNGFDLTGVPDAAVDIVYCTAVFMHLDEWDRYRYVSEAFRILRPGGRVYFDNFDLRSPQGWALFQDMCNLDVAVRPPNVSKASTAEELSWYAEKAGFEQVGIETGELWVTATGRKPAA